MYIPAQSLDDLLRSVFEKLLNTTSRIAPTKGPATEITGVLLKISHPRMRLSRTETKGTLFSCLGELLWYLAGTNSLTFIKYYLPQYIEYSDDKKTVYGGYGPRMFGLGRNRQVLNIIELLKRKPDSRQAVIQLFDAADILEEHKDIPCTCTLQFLIRKGRLHLLTSMRSNDAFRGLPHDVFAFTMLQEIMARALNIELGTYKHAVGSLHLYDTDRVGAQRYLQEDWQRKVAMPVMPFGDPWPSVKALLKVESKLRTGKELDISKLQLHSYWADLARILKVFQSTKSDTDTRKAARVIKQMASPVYLPYLKKRLERKVAPATPQQLEIVLEDET